MRMMASPDALESGVAAPAIAARAAPGAMQSSYDEIPYPSKPFPQSHPDRAATVAGLYGLDPARVDSCRVLELGCAHGDNLIPLALRFPQARFTGVDRSTVQIDAARAVSAELGIDNLTLLAADLMDLGPALGEFDYIVAHGVFSWVPFSVRKRILELCQRHLSPAGIAYVSYNVYPGWHARRAVREFLLFHTAAFTDPIEKMRQAKAALDVMEQAFQSTRFDDLKTYSAPFAELAQLVRQGGDAGLSYLFHEYLEEENEPMEFRAFVDLARENGLQFVSEANVFDMQAGPLPEPMARVIAGLQHDVERREQYRDYFSGRSFRQTLLCRAGAKPAREIDPRRLYELNVTGRLECSDPAADPGAPAPLRFKDGRGVESTVDDPITKSALQVLCEHWPASLSFAELPPRARARLQRDPVRVEAVADYERDTLLLAHHLSALYQAGSIELARVAAPIALTAGERPRAGAWTRHAAARGRQVVNLRYEVVDVSCFDRRLLALLDGTRDRAQLAEALAHAAIDEPLAIIAGGRRLEERTEIHDALAAQLDADLQRLARRALLES
jgi:SAM-dependent methyltransferase/methyltransferase-like protein